MITNEQIARIILEKAKQSCGRNGSVWSEMIDIMNGVQNKVNGLLIDDELDQMQLGGE